MDEPSNPRLPRQVVSLLGSDIPVEADSANVERAVRAAISDRLIRKDSKVNLRSFCSRKFCCLEIE